MTPLINPFIITGHIPDAYFCDREDESRRLLTALTNQQNVVLTSPRRMGKTKLIDHVMASPEVEGNNFVLSIDILQTGTLAEFTATLGHAVFSQVARRSDRLTKLFVSVLKSLRAAFSFDPVTGMPALDVRLGDIERPEYTLQEIFDFLDQTDRRCLVVIDEFQQIVNYPEKNVEALLRSHIQHSRNANFVFAGSQRHLMSELFASSRRPFYNSASFLHLDAIPVEVYTQFAVDRFSDRDKRIEPQAVQLAYDTFSGVTLYDQQAMNIAFALTPQGQTCDTAAMRHIISDMVSQNDRTERELLQFLTERQKEVLYAIFADQPVRSVTSAQFTRKHRLKSASSTQSAVRRLLQLDFITRVNGQYRISDPMMALWLKGNRL